MDKNLARETSLHEVGTANPNPKANASAQRHRGVGQDAENRLVTVPPACAVTQ